MGPPRSKRSKHSLSDIASASGPRTRKTNSPAPVAARPAPPVPTSEVTSRISPPKRTAAKAPVKIYEDELKPAPVAKPQSPPPLSPRQNRPLPSPTPRNSRIVQETPVVPSIILQRPTPQSTERNEDLPSVRFALPPSPTPSNGPLTLSYFPSPTPPPPSPMLPINIPQTGDAAMQKFFHDIVDQLQTMSLRTSPPMFQSPIFQSPNGSPYLGSDMAQFEDAADDASDIFSPINSPTLAAPPSPLLSGSPPVLPLSIRTKPNVDPLRARLSLRQPAPVARPSIRPHSTIGTVTPVSVVRRNTYGSTSEKENYGGPRAQGESSARPVLGLAIQSAGIPMEISRPPSPSPVKLKKRRCKFSF